jgi:hypothetical protein
MIFGATQSYRLRKRIKSRERCSLPNGSLNSLVIGSWEQLRSLPLIHDIKNRRARLLHPMTLVSLLLLWESEEKHSANVKVGYALDREC